jgi:hypothetical protein
VLLAAGCVASPFTPLPPRGEPFPEGSLAAAMEPAFVAELGDSEALAAWRDCGGALLYRRERITYPTVLPETFVERGVDRMRAFRAARPDASLELLSYAALDGLYQPEHVSERSLAAVQRTRDLSGQLSFTNEYAVEPIRFDGEYTEAEARAEADEPGFTTGVLAGVPSVALAHLDFRFSVRDFRAATDARGPLILDLRGADGARIDVVVELASSFLPKDALLFRIEGVGGEGEDHLTVRRRGAPSADAARPMLIVVDGETTLAPLMAAAALVDAGRARIAGAIGETIDAGIRDVTVWTGCRGPSSELRAFQDAFLERPALYHFRIPSGVIVRSNGEPLSDGLSIHYQVDPHDPAALEAVVARWLTDERAP